MNVETSLFFGYIRNLHFGGDMIRISFIYFLFLVSCCLLLAVGSSNESDAIDDPVTKKVDLFFHEDWRQIPAEVPVTQKHIQNPDMLITRYGPGGNSIKKSHHDEVPGDPWYVWSGLCDKRWALTLQKKNALVDLSSDGWIRLCTRQSGANVLKIILGLEDGAWLVSDTGFGQTSDWHEFTAQISVLKWRHLDIINIEAGDWVKEPDLNRVRSIGWTDLTTGKGSSACTRVDWIEVYGREIRLTKDVIKSLANSIVFGALS